MQWHTDAVLRAIRRAAGPAILAVAAAMVDVGLLDGATYAAVESVLRLFVW